MPQRPIIGNEIQNLTADGNTTAVKFEGGRGTFTAWGTFGSGTAKLQRSIDKTTWTDVTGASFTADDAINFEFGPSYVRVNLSGASSPDLNVSIAGYYE